MLRRSSCNSTPRRGKIELETLEEKLSTDVGYRCGQHDLYVGDKPEQKIIK